MKINISQDRSKLITFLDNLQKITTLAELELYLVHFTTVRNNIATGINKLGGNGQITDRDYIEKLIDKIPRNAEMKSGLPKSPKMFP